MTGTAHPIGVDLFCCAGGMSLGFEQAGFDVVAAVDIEKIHAETHLKNFPNCQTWCTDLSKTSGEQLRRETGIGNRQIDVVFAGPPCQGFSMIGKRLPSDPRNLLLHDLARLIVELSPSYLVVENVAGIMHGRAKDVLEEFVRILEAGGYCVVKPIRVLDAAEFGVPQRRRRVFVLGYLEGAAAPHYPKPLYSCNGNGGYHGPTVWDAIGDLPKIANYKYLFETDEYTGDLGRASAYASVLRGETPDPDNRSPERSRNGDGLSGCSQPPTQRRQ